jgi:hypothetical protein
MRALRTEQKDRIRKTCLAFIDLLEDKSPLPSGIGLKRLRDDFWEIRDFLKTV